MWVVVAIVITGLVVGWRLMHSRRVTAARVDDPERVWAWLQERLPHGFAWPDTLTPHESEAHVRRALFADAMFLSADADRALSELVVAVSDHRYAPQGATPSFDSLKDDARIVIDEVTSTKAPDATGRRSRVGGPSAPRRGA